MRRFEFFSGRGVAELVRKEWTVDGVKREALIALPTKTAGAPIIFAFHGHGGTEGYAARRWNLHSLWPEAIVVYGQGLPTITPNDRTGGGNGWQMGNFGFRPNRDKLFFDAMLATARKEWKVNEKKIYVTGHSNGAGFTYYLWGEYPTLFAALAPVSGGGERLIQNAKPCPILIIGAKNDTIVSWDIQQRGLDAAKKVNGSKAPVEVVLHEGGHAYPDMAPAKIIAFFKKHSR
jgi:polyhydroxybutyrate depolymerase